MANNFFWKRSDSNQAYKRPYQFTGTSTSTLESLTQRPRLGIGSRDVNAERPVVSGSQPVPQRGQPTLSGWVNSSQQPRQSTNRTCQQENVLNTQNSNQTMRNNEDGFTPVSELLPRFRSIFPFVHFNRVQSLVFKTMLESNRPIVVSAPTGSGKTGVFELAIVKMIMDSESACVNLGPSKVIYLAPTKALCTERKNDWEKKFSAFNIQCIELTSDVSLPMNFRNMTKPCILIATPEKWDSITRSWSGNKAFIQSIRLLLIDEVHLVNDGSRGSTLEAVISRMKTIRSLVWPTEQDNLRFIAVSATISNTQDIAEWFSTPSSKAEVFIVEAKDRPVKLRTIVMGFTTHRDMNEFSFDHQLNHRLANVIREHSKGKPTLIFCATRKSATAAATVLVKDGKFDMSFSLEQRKVYLELSSQVRDKTLQETTRFGIAFHHAGLCIADRRLIENGFLDGRVMILASTSTLALGVNLPAHLVIIKNTSFFDEGQFKPYGESQLVQMIGRAGRPQFDTEATAVIMTQSRFRDEIEKMLTGRLIVDSQLHKFLTEHLNSEIVLGTITNDSIARKWIDATFLHVRFMKNPENYGLDKKSSKAIKESTIIGWCRSSLDSLLQHKMIVRDNNNQLESTEAGRAMARHYICLDSAVKLMNLTGKETMCDLLKLICTCSEVTGDTQMRNEDKAILNSLIHPDDEKNQLRFPVAAESLTREKKAFVLIQATLGNLSINESAMSLESIRLMKNASRLVSYLRDVSLSNSSVTYKLLVQVILLSECFMSGLWENSIYVSKQLDKIGAVLSQSLAENGLTTFELLRKANPRNIEIFCSRLPPFGSNVQQTCFGLPIYRMDIKFRKVPNEPSIIQLMVEVSIENGLDLRQKSSLPRHHECVLIVGNVTDDKILLKQSVCDASILSRPDITVCYGADLDKILFPPEGGEIEAHLISEIFVGLNTNKSVKYVEPEEE